MSMTRSTYWNIVVYILSFVFLSSCATVITSSMPPYKFEKKGETKLGPVTTYDFDVEYLGGSKLKIYETPICMILQKSILVEKKQTRGAITALVELPIFGLGLADFVLADVIAENSKKEIDKGFIPSGKFKICGQKSPLKSAKIVIQFPISMSVVDTYTDSSGILHLEEFIKAYHDNILNLFVKKDDSIYYLTTIYINQ